MMIRRSYRTASDVRLQNATANGCKQHDAQPHTRTQGRLTTSPRIGEMRSAVQVANAAAESQLQARDHEPIDPTASDDSCLRLLVDAKGL